MSLCLQNAAGIYGAPVERQGLPPPLSRNSGLGKAPSPSLSMWVHVGCYPFVCYFAVWLDPFGEPVGLQACLDCELRPFTTQRGHSGAGLFPRVFLDKYPGACGIVMQCIYLRKGQQQSSPVDRVSSLSSKDIEGPLLHVPSEPGTWTESHNARVPAC